MDVNQRIRFNDGKEMPEAMCNGARLLISQLHEIVVSQKRIAQAIVRGERSMGEAVTSLFDRGR